MKEALPLDDAQDFIEVRINVDDVPKPFTLGSWAKHIQEKLAEAGVPLDEKGQPISGALRRFDDPKDFGVTVYQWFSDKAIRA